MNIGFISQALPYLPSRDGFRLYGANLIRQLSQRHRIELISLFEEGEEHYLDWPRQYCSTVSTIPKTNGSLLRRFSNVCAAYVWGRPLASRREMEAALRAGVAPGRWDVLHVEGAYAGGLVPPDLPIPKILSLHDSWTLRCAEMLKCSRVRQEKLYYTFLKQYEPRYERLVYSRFNACTVVSDRDLREVRRVVPTANVIAIPNGIDSEYFHPIAVERERGVLVFHGHWAYAPNIEAALEFANDVLPLIQKKVPTATLHLVGASPGAKIRGLASRPGIRISADLPDLRAAICSGQVYVSAIRHGTGLKNKMLEAMAMGLPIVCYRASMAGIEAVPGNHLLVVEDHQQFAASVVHLLCNPQRAEQIAGLARRLVEEKYGWGSRARAYEDLYETVLHGPSQIRLDAFTGLRKSP